MLMIPLLRAAIELGASSIADAGRRAATQVVTMLLALAMFLASLGFLTFAAYRALAAGLGDIHAALILAGIYLIAALCILLVQQRRSR
jgi:dipeptide/tripeptide permease